MQSPVIKFTNCLPMVGWFSPGTLASFTTKTGHHDIAEILLKVALNTISNQIVTLPLFYKFHLYNSYNYHIIDDKYSLVSNCHQLIVPRIYLYVNHPLKSTRRLIINMYCIGRVMVSMIVWSALDRGFEPRSCENKDNKIDICCFSTWQAALRSKSKD